MSNLRCGELYKVNQQQSETCVNKNKHTKWYVCYGPHGEIDTYRIAWPSSCNAHGWQQTTTN